MNLTAEEARLIIYGDTSEWDEIERNTTDTSRWSVYFEGVFKHIPSGKHYTVDWSEGATEMQDEAPFKYAKDVAFTEVELKEVTIKKWVIKK